MRSLPTASTLAIALALAAVGATGVRAADMPEYPPIIEAPEPLPLPAAGGWYLRGDIGYKWYNTPDGSMDNPNFAGGSFEGRQDMKSEGMGDSFNIGVGAGYKFNDYLRADLTLDYETPGEFHGRLYCPGGGGGCDPHPTEEYSYEKADITAWSALANVYADLGTYGGLTPYVGGGIGVSYLQTSGFTSSAEGDDFGDDGQWNFAWALMAGASYAVTDQLSVDLGYRYLNLGDARSASLSDADGQSTRLHFEDIDAHEVRLGLRYNLF